MPQQKISKLRHDVENIQGLAGTLVLLDGYPGEYEKKVRSAVHCLHSYLESYIDELVREFDDLEEATKSI
ncbi:hypothetical protein SAMN04488056_112138 [Cohaesibacter marisflavi]|uniref:Uncharacterized protein n=1 Tax=Cohaesibacter marisflavi TaxID=655353 RepID=A0A1I5JWS1_9HYPH|nr:hypothetical protein [Cohaesibacter marisflavi]SFO77189.1 hypothetical protein SAMN04488056_112138 [Cohaesibacter marisflavi]